MNFVLVVGSGAVFVQKIMTEKSVASTSFVIHVSSPFAHCDDNNRESSSQTPSGVYSSCRLVILDSVTAVISPLLGGVKNPAGEWTSQCS